MRTMKLLTMTTAALALLVLPVAAQARVRHGVRSHAPRSAGVVRSFRNGVLTVRLAGGGTKTGDVTDSTKLTCEAKRSKRRKARGRLARVAAETDPGEDPGATDGTADDTADDPADTGDDTADDTGDDSGDDTGDGADDPGLVGPQHFAKGRLCSTAKLRRGMRIKAAKLGSGPNGAVWARVALLRR
jgi:hypothetical protein